MGKVTAKPENIVTYQFSDVIEDPYKVATERLHDFQSQSNLKERFMKLDSRACIAFLSQIVKDME